MTRQEIMENPSVHSLTKEVLELSKGKDVVDCVYDVNLALLVLRLELAKALGVRTQIT